MELYPDDVHVHYERNGKASGEAFVQFHSSADCENALKRNMEKIGSRWVSRFYKIKKDIFFLISWSTQRLGRDI